MHLRENIGQSRLREQFSTGDVIGSIKPTRRGPSATTQLLHGGTLKTWSYRSTAMEAVQVVLDTEGGPLDADVELWQGPDNAPVKMRVYVENGLLSPFNAVIETKAGPSTVAIKNIGAVDFPMSADVVADSVEQASQECLASSVLVQGGSILTYQCDEPVDAVQVLVHTNGRPLNARVELLRGPNHVKQVVQLYAEDGLYHPFFCVLETPGVQNEVRIVNAASAEFPIAASVVPAARHDGSYTARRARASGSAAASAMGPATGTYTPYDEGAYAISADYRDPYSYERGGAANALAPGTAATSAAERAEAAKAAELAAKKSARWAQVEADAAAAQARAVEAEARAREEEAKRLETEAEQARRQAQASAQKAQEDAVRARGHDRRMATGFRARAEALEWWR